MDYNFEEAWKNLYAWLGVEMDRARDIAMSYPAASEQAKREVALLGRVKDEMETSDPRNQ